MKRFEIRVESAGFWIPRWYADNRHDAEWLADVLLSKGYTVRVDENTESVVLGPVRRPSVLAATEASV